MESIYKYICKNIQNNGKLKDGFNLDIYNKLDDYLDNLSQLDSAIITLRLNNFKYFEIEELLEVSSSHISRVIKAMREKIKISC